MHASMCRIWPYARVVGSGSVLVAESDRRLRAGLGRALRRRGLAVALAQGCADALDLAAADRPALLLLDTGLRGWLDVALVLRGAFGPALPILLTGPPRRSSAPFPRANRNYLTKPLDPFDVAARVVFEVALAERAAA
jgi:DNA-binding response OmpR family regulator